MNGSEEQKDRFLRAATSESAGEYLIEIDVPRTDIRPLPDRFSTSRAHRLPQPPSSSPNTRAGPDDPHDPRGPRPGEPTDDALHARGRNSEPPRPRAFPAVVARREPQGRRPTRSPPARRPLAQTRCEVRRPLALHSEPERNGDASPVSEPPPLSRRPGLWLPASIRSDMTGARIGTESGHFRPCHRNACLRRRPGTSRHAIGLDLAPASVESSSRGSAIAFHATRYGNSMSS
jgi:hypothetical protein